MAEFTVVVHQIVRYTFPIEASDRDEAWDQATQRLATGDWPDDNNTVVDDKFEIQEGVE